MGEGGSSDLLSSSPNAPDAFSFLITHEMSSPHLRECNSTSPLHVLLPQKAPSSRLTGSLRRWLLGGAAPTSPVLFPQPGVLQSGSCSMLCPSAPHGWQRPGCWVVPSARSWVVGWLILPFFGMSLFHVCRCRHSPVPGVGVLAAGPGALSSGEAGLREGRQSQFTSSLPLRRRRSN